MDRRILRQIANHILDRNHSAETRQRYLRQHHRMRDKNPDEYCQERGLGQRTYYFSRAAYLIGEALALKAALTAEDQAFRHENCEATRLARCDANERARRILAYLSEEELPPGFVSTAQSFGGGLGAKYEGPRKECGKRRRLRGKPDNWRELVCANLPEKYQFPAWVMGICGCRVEELMHGISLRIGTLNDTKSRGLEVYINGAKTGQGYGQGWRVLLYDVQGDVMESVYACVVENGSIDHEGFQALSVTLPKSKKPKDAFRKAFVRAADHVFGQGHGLSPISMRHQFSANLKMAIKDPAEIAMALGHCSDRTQSYYGMASQARGGVGLVQIAAEKKVKMHSPGYLKNASPESGSSPSPRG